MKFDKWTVALAAAGVVSLASAAKAEESASSVMTALASTTLSGYVDTSAQWNFGTGNANLPPYRFGGASKADGFNFNVVQLRLDKPLDETEWAAGYRVDLWAGPDANSLGTQSLFGNNSSASTGDFAIRQAYVALRTPVLPNGIDWKVGVFDSIIGYESIESPNNPNFTRSYGNTIEPTTHTGVLASYRFSDLVNASFGVANTVGPQINSRAFSPAWTGTNPKAESYKTYMGSIAITAPESMGFLAGSTLYGGVVNGFATSGNDGQNTTSWYAGATMATPVTGLRFGGAFDYLDVHNMSGETWTLAGYASLQATEKLSLHARAEYLRNRGEQAPYVPVYMASADPSTKTLALTATVQYDLWQNVLSRLELRWDHSLDAHDAFGGDVTGEPTLLNAWMLAGNIVYKF